MVPLHGVLFFFLVRPQEPLHGADLVFCFLRVPFSVVCRSGRQVAPTLIPTLPARPTRLQAPHALSSIYSGRRTTKRVQLRSRNTARKRQRRRCGGRRRRRKKKYASRHAHQGPSPRLPMLARTRTRIHAGHLLLISESGKNNREASSLLFELVCYLVSTAA